MLAVVLLLVFQIASVNAVNEQNRPNRGQRCPSRANAIVDRVQSLRSQVQKASSALGNSAADPLLLQLNNALTNLGMAARRQIGCDELKPSVNALNQFNSLVNSPQATIDAKLGKGISQSWISQSNSIINQILTVCPCT